MAVVGELADDLLVGAARAVSVGVSTLRHEALDDAVERQAVVEALARELGEVGHRDGRHVGVKLELDRPVALDLDRCVVRATRVLA